MENTVLILRKELGLNQEKFGERLGVGKTAISKLEKGYNNLTEQMARSICREFNVNEDWLRTGEGDMFINYEDEQTELDYLIGKLASDGDAFKIKFIKFMLRQPDERWDVIEKMIDDYLNAKK